MFGDKGKNLDKTDDYAEKRRADNYAIKVYVRNRNREKQPIKDDAQAQYKRRENCHAVKILMKTVHIFPPLRFYVRKFFDGVSIEIIPVFCSFTFLLAFL
jgi:hypothetical protein